MYARPGTIFVCDTRRHAGAALGGAAKARAGACAGVSFVRPAGTASARRARGFTLLEMLVVLVIAGILVSVASLTLRRNPRTDLREEAQRIALLFETAGDEAQVRARPIAWRATEHGFRFDIRTGDGWRPLRDDVLRARLGWRRDGRGDRLSRLGHAHGRGRIRHRKHRRAGARHAVFGGRQRDDRRHRQRPLRGAVTMRAPAPPRSPARSRGFTMIEVLVALAIIAVALAASIRAVGSMATGASDLHARLLAGWSADNALAQLRLAHAWPDIGMQTFDCSQGNVALTCTQRVSSTPNPVFRRVEIAVSMNGRAGVLAQMVTVVANETSRPL
ncbi:general secretory pathway protein I [Burkholderia pseudomallei]|nr:general secretory pathway protein I [Burkholderia pseudomallei]